MPCSGPSGAWASSARGCCPGLAGGRPSTLAAAGARLDINARNGGRHADLVGALKLIVEVMARGETQPLMSSFGSIVTGTPTPTRAAGRVLVRNVPPGPNERDSAGQTGKRPCTGFSASSGPESLVWDGRYLSCSRQVRACSYLPDLVPLFPFLTTLLIRMDVHPSTCTVFSMR